MTVVIGTAGHIDHGKTALLRALTGIDADRLPEERRRGMTIDVGYAHGVLPDGTAIDYVDVPGHDRLVGNMLVGAGEVDGALLVVAADDGPRAQTVEHLELLDALGVTDAVVAVTKTDLVGEERVAEVQVTVRALLDRTALAAAPLVAVSAVTGQGVEALLAALAALGAAIDARVRTERPARLAIDRTFTVRGRGTVVTGTLRGGPVGRGDALRLVPGGQQVVAREVQVHGNPVEHAEPGRTAVNVRGVDATTLRRGLVLTHDPDVVASERVLVALRPPSPIRAGRLALPPDRARLRLHLGTEQVDATVGRAGREAVELGQGAASAILRLDRPLAVTGGDRFVLRDPGSGTTAAGGVVIDPVPPRGIGRRRATRERIVALAAAPGRATRLDLHGALVEPGRVALAADVEERLAGALLGAVTDEGLGEAVGDGRAGDRRGTPVALLRARGAGLLRTLVTIAPDAAGRAAGAALDRLVAAGRLARDGDLVTDPAVRVPGPPAATLEAMDRLVDALDTVAPPPLRDAARAAGCPEPAVRALERDGRIVCLGPDLAWSAEAWARLATLALDRARVGPLTPAALRDATGTSRKYVMALLEDLGRRGILARTPEGHVPGPRAATIRAREPVA